ncbi:hypothetical protein WHR41_06359 [Cladosporium halotolerans]|uniref:Alpha-galactosidase A n=1 Tax=Cladosporium halotolerans TaxID=1052096 RepID=A0AB34KLD4_9PEZI
MARTIQLLHASIDNDNDDAIGNYFRLLVDNTSIKYIFVPAGAYRTADLLSGPGIKALLPPLPPGDWNSGSVSKDPRTGRHHFDKVQREAFHGVTNAWHPLRVDYLALSLGKQLGANAYEATSVLFEGAVVAKLARFEWEVDQVDEECEAYGWLEGSGVGPRFLGHVVEEGRVVGFLLEKVANARRAGVGDLRACEGALGRLHALGLVHGDVKRGHFLVNGDGATLIDFNLTRKPGVVGMIEEEMESLGGLLGGGALEKGGSE